MKLSFESREGMDVFETAPVRRALAVLQKLPRGALIDMATLAQRIGIMRPTLRESACSPRLAAYRIVYKGHVWWGNAATIRHARKELCENHNA